MEKLAALRAQMKERGLDGYIVVSGDAHNSEYVATHWNVREWLSGFNGSNGTVVVTATKAGLWTDGRYFIQAANQLKGSGIDLFKINEPGVPTYQQFLKDNLPQDGRLGFDGRTITSADFDALKKILMDKKITYAYQEDVAGNLWAARPPMPTAAAFEHETRFAGLEDKLKLVRDKMKEKGVTAYLVVALDDMAWLTNMRGSDVLYTPLVYSYALITETEAHLFVEPSKVAGISAKLEARGFTINDYHALNAKIRTMPTGGKLLYNAKMTNMMLAEAIPGGLKVLRKPDADIIPFLKAAKSPTELKNSRNAYVKDSIVYVKMLMWLEKSLADGKTLHEADVVKFLAEARTHQPDSLGDSFSTICAYGANAAQMHYRVEGDGAEIKREGFLLVDSGGQYLDGTTDSTRTIPVGEITAEMKKDFTLIVKSHINLARAKFLKGTTGHALDMLARQPLWEHGMQYKCGTGHGIGYCLGVHEGPQSLSQMATNTTALVPGMLVTNEPGVYKEGRHGIRTENVLVVEELFTNDDGTFYGFSPLTYIPICLNSIDKELLNAPEIEYLNDYHKKVFDTLSPLLSQEEVAWLQNATRAL